MSPASAASPASDALLAAALLAVDPAGLGGATLRAGPGPERDAWLEALRALLPSGTPWGRVPLGVADDRLLGGMDLVASLSAGRPVVERGVLAAHDGGVAVLAMAERIEDGVAARVAAVLDAGEVVVERDGLAARLPARLGLVLLDEGIEPEERPPAALTERLAFRPDVAGLGRTAAIPSFTAEGVAEARERLAEVAAPSAAAVEALCAAAAAFGLDSVRPPLLALHAARAHAALAGRAEIEDADLAAATRLVLLPRAVAFPLAEAEADAPPPPEAHTDASEGEDGLSDGAGAERVLDAVQAVLPDGLMERIVAGNQRGARTPRRGGAGAAAKAAKRGRPAGSRPGRLKPGDRLDLPATLRAAAPWARLRQDSQASDPSPLPRSSRRRPGPSSGSEEAGTRHPERPARDDGRTWVPASAGMSGSERGVKAASDRIPVRAEDFRIRRFIRRRESTTIFLVDASGSAAFQRLAEAKGAVELLLAKAYVTRSRVALVAFRDAGAQVLLEPTRSLTRARRSLADLPGGGGTPLAHGLDLALDLARAETAHGRTPLLVVLTDGRANVARDGSGGRAAAERDALAAAARVREAGIGAAYLDTSARPQPGGDRFAAAMGAVYAPLPYADPAKVSAVVADLRGARP